MGPVTGGRYNIRPWCGLGTVGEDKMLILRLKWTLASHYLPNICQVKSHKLERNRWGLRLNIQGPRALHEWSEWSGDGWAPAETLRNIFLPRGQSGGRAENRVIEWPGWHAQCHGGTGNPGRGTAWYNKTHKTLTFRKGGDQEALGSTEQGA